MTEALFKDLGEYLARSESAYTRRLLASLWEGDFVEGRKLLDEHSVGPTHRAVLAKEVRRMQETGLIEVSPVPRAAGVGANRFAYRITALGRAVYAAIASARPIPGQPLYAEAA